MPGRRRGRRSTGNRRKSFWESTRVSFALAAGVQGVQELISDSNSEFEVGMTSRSSRRPWP